MEEMEGKDRFLRAYSNIPLGVRKEIILVINNKPITWDVAYVEIDNNTEMGKKILMKLIEMEMI